MMWYNQPGPLFLMFCFYGCCHSCLQKYSSSYKINWPINLSVNNLQSLKQKVVVFPANLTKLISSHLLIPQTLVFFLQMLRFIYVVDAFPQKSSFLHNKPTCPPTHPDSFFGDFIFKTFFLGGGTNPIKLHPYQVVAIRGSSILYLTNIIKYYH